LLSRKERLRRLERASYNIFKLDGEDIYIDLLTDSGTSAMSVQQWAALMLGDETYAGAKSFRKFEATVRDITGKKHVIPCHQGRSAENLVFTNMVKRGQYVINNTHFDTTRGNTQHKGGIAVDLPSAATRSDEAVPFKGDMDVHRLDEMIHEKGRDQVAMVIMTITNNSVGGQPVSMANIRETAQICRNHGVPLFFDCARFAENAFFIKRDEPGYEEKSIENISKEMFSYCDGAMMSAKKDGLSNIGGFIAVNDDESAAKLRELLILVEGFPTYGGLAGRDLEVLAVGLREVMNYDYLDYRIAQVAYFGQVLKDVGLPIVEPTGGHAVFCDAGKLLDHIPPEQFPGQSLTVALYAEGAIRTVEIGSLMFGGIDPNTGEELTAPRELVRMALPRRVYTNSQLDYIAEVAARIVAGKEQLSGYRITRQPVYLRHFTCDLEALSPEGITVST
jgi:tryptophanase